ncbi:MAG: hypothetical protein BAJATHORv1_50010 [Candidatus Thorarchaeota archaeon]|nr:MAG: hypothetical protein BAJATHORv1_50010 [Candidatus Thorarchaeota archaeon]
MSGIVFLKPYNRFHAKKYVASLEATPGIKGRMSSLKQDRLTDYSAEKIHEMTTTEYTPISVPSSRFLDIDEDYKSHPLWTILVECVKRNPLYPGLVSYFRSKIQPDSPDMSPRELASKLSITVGEALVILHDCVKPE